MPRGRAKPKAVATEYFTLDTPADLIELLKDLTEFQGVVSKQVNPDGAQVWAVQLTRRPPGEVEFGPRSQPLPTVTAQLGEVAVFDGNDLITMTAEDFKARYTA